MSWVPLLLAAWVLVDILVVVGMVTIGRRRSQRAATPTTRPPGPPASGPPSRRTGRTTALGGWNSSRFVH